MKIRAIATVGFLLAAGVAAVAPIPPALVERVYSTGVYPALQGVITTLSNRAPFAMLDVLIVLGVIWLGVLIATAWRAIRYAELPGVLRVLVRLLLPASALYLAFLLLWGFNYRRLPLEDKLPFDAAAVTPDGARALADVAVARINALYAGAHAAGWADDDPSLNTAFVAATREAGLSASTVPGRPRRSLLDWYFRSAAVAGMTDPFFLETLVASDLLPFERPFVIAHEWSHLAGFADEGEANFVGWLTCLHGSVPVQYSGWLSLYAEVIGGLPRRTRADVAARLDAGPREDMRALADRLIHNVNPTVSAAGWRVYDRYLKANRVEDGSASYARVVRLVLGTQVGRRATQDRSGR